MALDPTATAALAYSTIMSGMNETFMPKLTTILDNAFQAGVPELSNYLFTPAAGTLNFPITIMPTGNKAITPETFGTSIAAYWTLAIGPGSPVSCDGIDSVINDASKIAPIITAGLTTLGMAASENMPPYQEFMNVIFGAISTIVWTIEESDSDCSSTLTGGVS